jgi:chromosome segregation ATPase
MATVKQTDVKWVPKDKKTGKGGFLALRSAPNKAFTGTVTGIKQGTTNSRNGVATYSGGKNVAAVAARKSAKLNTPSAGRKAASTASAKTRVAKATGVNNTGYTAGTGSLKKPAAVQAVSAARKSGAKADATSRANRAASSRGSSTPAVRKASDWLGDVVSNFQNRETTADRQLRSLKNSLESKKRSIKSAEAMRNASQAEKTRQTQLQQEIANLQKQINSIK